MPLFGFLFMFNNLPTPTVQWQSASPLPFLVIVHHLLSTGEESAWLWKPRPVFTVGTDSPDDCRNAEDDETHDCGVCFPIGRLRIPSSSW